jgi:branched-chain amino acid transport system permease protein
MSGTQKVGLAAVLIALALAPTALKNYGTYLLTLWCVYVMAAMGLNLTVGYAGLISLGHAAFLGIGAYTAAILMKAGVAFGFVLPAAALLCFAVGLALGFPALRVRHHYLAFATLLFALLIRSPWGRAFAALRDNPIRAESLGVNIVAYTLLAFAIGAACAGIAGAYFAALVQFIDPAPFHLTASLIMLLMVIVGGSGRFFGPMLGAALVVLLPEWLRFMKDWYLVVFGLSVVALMIWLPGGLLSIPDRIRLRSALRGAVK